MSVSNQPATCVNQRREYLHEFEDDYVWIHENHEELVQRFADHWIGVKNREVLVADRVLNHLLSRLRERKYDPTHVVVEFVPRDRAKVIL